MRLATLLFLLATVSALAFRSEGIRTALAVRAIAPGMTIEEAEALLAPHIVAKGFSHGMGACGPTYYFHLKGDLELEVQMGWFLECDRIDRISSPCKKQTWDRVFWEPTNDDRYLAFEVAFKGIEAELAEPETLGIEFDDAQWRTHRLLDVTLVGESGWQRSVTVDVDDRRIVTAP